MKLLRIVPLDVPKEVQDEAVRRTMLLADLLGATQVFDAGGGADDFTIEFTLPQGHHWFIEILARNVADVGGYRLEPIRHALGCDPKEEEAPDGPPLYSA